MCMHLAGPLNEGRNVGLEVLFWVLAVLAAVYVVFFVTVIVRIRKVMKKEGL